MEILDNNPDHFEFALKFMYTLHYGKESIEILAGGDEVKRVLIPNDIYVVADKYDIIRLYEPAGQDFDSIFNTRTDNNDVFIKAVVEACYSSISQPDSVLGKLVAFTARKRYTSFIMTDEFDHLLRSFPVFGTDITLSCKQDGMHVFNARTAQCIHHSCRVLNMRSMRGLNDNGSYSGNN
jgi:hypothetical protein